MAFQGGAPKTCPPAAADAPAATLRVKFWPEPSKWDDRRRRPRSNTQPMQLAVAQIVPAADKQTSRASAKIRPPDNFFYTSRT